MSPLLRPPRECLVLTASSGSDQDEGRPEAPPLELPCPPVKTERRKRAQSVPPPLAGRFAEAPAAALLPPATPREFPKSRPKAGAMLISPIFALV